jgi:MFS family permease
VIRLASFVADILGRRMGVTIGLIIVFIGVIIQAVPAVDASMFIAGRFLVGLGCVPTSVPGPRASY